MRNKDLMTIRMRRSALLLLTMLLLPFGAWAQTLTVGGVDATDADALTEAFDGTVTFSASDNTLTLDGANIEDAGIESQLSALTIKIKGSNSISSTTQSAILFSGTATAGTLIFVKDDDYEGVCELSLDAGGNSAISGFVSISYGEGVSMAAPYGTEYDTGSYELQYNPYDTDVMSLSAATVTSATVYQLWYDGTQVTSANAAELYAEDTNVRVSFDVETNTLTFNGLDGGYGGSAVINNLSALNVFLVGENSMAGESMPIFRNYNDNAVLNFKTNVSSPGSLTIMAEEAFDGFETINYENDLVYSYDGEETPTYTIAIPATEYGIKINMSTHEASITKNNRGNVDGNGKIQFDGKNTLILNGANIGGITIESTNTLSDKGLIVYLKGNNTITNSTTAISNQDTRSLPLTFQTTDKDPGSLAYICQTCTLTVVKSAFDGFDETIKYDNGLVGKLDYTATEVAENHQNYTINDSEYISQQTVTINVPLPLVVEEVGNKTIDGDGAGLGTDVDDIDTPEKANISGGGVVRNNVLYTFGDGDGSYVEDGKNYVNLTTNQDGVPTDKQPGTREFAEALKGATMLFPAGSHVMTVNYRNYAEAPNARLCVQVGQGAGDTWWSLPYSTTPTLVDIPLVLSAPTHVFLFSHSAAASSRTYNDRRAPGRKETTTVGIGGLNINSSAVDVTPEPALSPKFLDKSMMATWITGNHITVNDADVEDLDADAFDDLTGGASPAPRRAPVIPSFVTYVDLTGTAIKDKEVDRTQLPFSKLNENTFIYMPAGNTVKAGTKNVVVGSVCDKMELAEAKQLEVAKDFTALDASLDRTFDTEKTGTIYLPFALNEEKATEMGKFYKLTSYDGSTVTMTSVTSTVANTPYMFKPAKTTLTAEMVEVKKTAPASPTADGITFKGTYASTSIVSDGSTQYYCFMADGDKAGKFVHVTDNAVTVSPYRAYMVKSGASARDLDVIIDGFATGVSVVRDMRTKMDGVFYDLSGRRVLYPTKGLYIVNGKKVFVAP